MNMALAVASTIRFHLSLNVANLGRAVDFYRTLFGTEPAKCRPDYAKFELDNPPLVLSLEPSARGGGGALNHLGFRMPDSTALVAMQERLEKSGISCRREEGVECCYARQTKFWVHDPEGTLWEIYTFEGDIEHRGAGQAPDAVLAAPSNERAAATVSWSHRLGEPVPARIPLADGTADEIVMLGTFNMPLPREAGETLVREAYRALKPNGRIFVHVLVGDRPLEGAPDLPGPAAAVQHVPLQSEPVELLQRHGFHGIRMLKFDGKPCFLRRSVAMRELQLEGWKDGSTNGAKVRVLYKGPLLQVTDDVGTILPRGKWVQATRATADRLRAGEASEHFVLEEL